MAILMYMRTLREAETYRRLDLREMGLAFFPREICTLTMLLELSLAANDMKIIPHDIKLLSGLSKLRLQENMLTLLPPEIGELNKLTSIDLSQVSHMYACFYMYIG